MKNGFLALVLHAHLPFVKHPEVDDSLEEHWLFETITETYVPLLLMFENLVKEGVDFKITVSLSPSLLTMLSDPILQYRYMRRLQRLVELAAKEVGRTKDDIKLHKNALANQARLLKIKSSYEDHYQRDLVTPFRNLQDSGHIEILGSTATHAILPLLQPIQLAVKNQLKIGLDYYKRMFGRAPKGLWLPECAYYSGLGEILAANNVEYVFLETLGVTRANPSPEFGVYEPICDEAGVRYFGRDPESSRQVWSSEHGYPGNAYYREFYRDIGYDLDYDYLKPCIFSPSLRFDTGFKYHRITGQDNNKEIYDAGLAEHTAKGHAKDFVLKKQQQISYLQSQNIKNPIITAPFDAELFGHWWWEGIVWLEHVLREIDKGESDVGLVTVNNYLEINKDCFPAEPCASSWGRNGYFQVWLNPDNDWIYRHINNGAKRLASLAEKHKSCDSLIDRAFNQALRELLLAQASDWSFMIGCKTYEEYGRRRVENHISNLNKLIESIITNEIDEVRLSVLECGNSLFKDIDYRVFLT